MDTLMQVVERDPVPLRQLNADVPRDLETIALKCLQKDPRAGIPRQRHWLPTWKTGSRAGRSRRGP